MSETEIHAVRPAAAESEVTAGTAGAAVRIPLAVAALDADYAVLSRRIGRGCSTFLSIAGEDAVLALHLASEAPSEWRDPLVLSGAAGALEIEDGARLIRGLCGIDLGSEQIARGDDYGWLHAAVLGRLQETPFAAVERIACNGDIPADAVTLRIVLRADNHAFSVHARGSAAVWLDLLSRAPWVREQWRHPALSSLSFALPVLLARHTLPAHALRSLQAGDVILPSASRFTCDATGVVSLRGNVMRVRYCAPGALEILHMEEKMDDQTLDLDNMDDTEFDADDEQSFEHDDGAEYAAEAEQGAGATASLPVTLDFNLGHVRTTLAELDALNAGSVLILEDGSPASIAIVSGGHVLGRGEAVDVNGRLGIRIVQWG